MSVEVNDVPGEIVVEFRLLSSLNYAEGWHECRQQPGDEGVVAGLQCGFDAGGTYELRGSTTDGAYEGGTTVVTKLGDDNCHVVTKDVTLVLEPVE